MSRYKNNYPNNGHASWVEDFVLINSSLLASSSADATIKLWDLNTNTCKLTIVAHTNTAHLFGLKLVSSDTLASASGSPDSLVKLWNITSGALIRTLTGHSNDVCWSLDLMSDGQTLVSGSNDQTIKLWNWKTGVCLNTINAGFGVRSLTVLNTTKSIRF